MNNEEKVVRTYCGECPHRREGMLANIKDSKVVKITGDSDSWSKGLICVKGIRGAIEATYHKDRVLHPMKRVGERGEGKWQRIKWDEAIDIIADGFEKVRSKYGPLSILGIVSNATCFSRSPAVVLLMRSLDNPNLVVNTDLCDGSQNLDVWLTGHEPVHPKPGCRGGYIVELGEPKCILCIGGNLAHKNPMGWAKWRQLKSEGIKTIVVDPRRTEAAELADIWLQIRPGTDAALALGMMNVIINEGLYDKEFVENYTYGFDKLKERVQEYPPEKVARITELKAEDIVNVARMFSTIKPAKMQISLQALNGTNGTQSFRAFSCLNVITGNVILPNKWQKYTGFVQYADIKTMPEFQLPREVAERRLGAKIFPLYCGPDGLDGGVCHNPTVINAMLTGDPYPVKALYITGQNFITTRPAGRDFLEGMLKCDFIVHACYEMNPTTEYADIILPKTTSLEEDELNYDHLVLYGKNRAIEPQGEAWDDHKIAYMIIERMREKGYIEKNFFQWKNLREFCDYLLKNTDLTFDELTIKGEVPLHEYGEQSFPTPTGKIELYSTVLEKHGYDPLPNFHEPPESKISTPFLAKRFPLILFAGTRNRTYRHSLYRNHEWARKIYPYPELEVHPNVAKERGISDGDFVYLETSRGRDRAKLKAKISERAHPQVVSTNMGWWLPEMPGPEHGCFEVNISATLSYGPPWDPICGAPETRAVLCEVTKI